MRASRYIAAVTAAIMVMIMAVPFTSNAAAAEFTVTPVQSVSGGVLVLENGQVWYRVSRFDDDKDYIITVKNRAGEEVMLTASDGEKSHNVWHYYRQTMVSSMTPRYTSLSCSGCYLVCSGENIRSAYTRSISGDSVWEHVGSALRYNEDGTYSYLRYDEDGDVPFSFTQEQDKAAEVNIYTNGDKLERCIVNQPHAESYVTENSGYEAPEFTVGLTDMTVESVKWYVDGEQQICSEPAFTADVLAGRPAGAHRVYCTVEGRDSSGIHYRERSEDALFVIAKGVVPDSVLTFSDVHEEYSLIGKAIETVMQRTGGYIPSLIVCTGDLVNGPTAYTEVMMSTYYPRIKAELGGLDAVFVSGNHDPGEAASAMSAAAGLGAAGILPPSGGTIFDGTSQAVSANGTNSRSAKGVKVYGLNFEAAACEKDAETYNSYEGVLGSVEAFLKAAAEDYRGELLVISAHSGLHVLGMQPESVNLSGGRLYDWIGSNAYNIDRSYDLAQLINSYAEQYGMDIIYLFGHDHSRGETELFMSDGDTLISTKSFSDGTYGTLPLSFTYANAGYLSTVIGSASEQFSFIYRDDGKYSFDLISLAGVPVRHTEFAAKYRAPETTASTTAAAATTTTTAAVAATGKGGSPVTGDGANTLLILLPAAGLLLSRKRKK